MQETIFNLKEVYKYGKKYKSSLIWQAIACIIGIVINVGFPLIYARFVVGFTNSMWEQAILMALCMFIVNIIDRLHVVLIRKNTQVFRRGAVKNLQLSLGKEILNLEQREIDSNSSGLFIQRIINDTDNMSAMFTVGMGNLTGVLSNIGSFIAILIIDYHLFIYYLITSIILTVLNVIKIKAVTKKEIAYRKQSDKVAGFTGELVRGSRDIKMLYAKDSFLNELGNSITIQSEKNFDMRNVEIKHDFFIGCIKRLFELGLILYLIFLVRKNILTVAVAFALYGYRVSLMADMMQKISELLEESKNFNISCNRVFEIINGKSFSKEVFGNNKIDKIEGNFEFRNVSFRYGKNLVLNKLNFKIESGTTTGIVGKSGAGKTTIFNLLCKLYDVNHGEVLIDGVNIKDLDEKSIRDNITIISQNPYIFNMSIKDNLRLVKNNVTDKEIKEACKLSCLDDFINTLPDKYNTIVGEGGVNLSGGQRQRLAIARALVQDTKIILFDEATSALDNETQSKIQTAIDNLKNDYTVIIIAHRLSTIINCDKIIVIDDGKVIDSGTHKELLKKSKEYKKLCDTEIINSEE